MKAILLIMIGLSSLGMAEESSRFTKADGVVTDTKTTLEWQDDYSDNGDSVKYAKWVDAINYCQELTLGGNDDWRLPNQKELLSIVDYSTYNPAISSVFQNTTSSHYWSSTTSAGYSGFAWSVSFYFGNMKYGRNFKSVIESNVRCVRLGEFYAPA